MSAEMLAGVAGILLSLLFAYVPKFKPWFESKKGTTKRLVMGGSLIAAAVGAFGLSCWQPETFRELVVCSDAGLLDVLWLAIVALVTNQSAYSIAVKES